MFPDSLGEIRRVLADVCNQLGTAYHHAGVARDRLTDAETVLAALSEQHHESLVPPQLRHAETELDRGLDLITNVMSLVTDLGARL